MKYIEPRKVPGTSQDIGSMLVNTAVHNFLMLIVGRSNFKKPSLNEVKEIRKRVFRQSRYADNPFLLDNSNRS